MTWKEVLDSNVKTVTVESYGYTERNIFGSHFEPFAHKREFQFEVLEFSDGFAILKHKWLNLEELEEDLFFEQRNGKIYLDDPELWARP